MLDDDMVALRTRLAGMTLCDFAPSVSLEVGRQRAIVHGETVALTFLECEVLAILTARAPHIVSHEDLTQAVWGYPDPLARRLSVVVCRLRHKLGPESDVLHTHRGVGYSFDSGPWVVSA